KLAAQLIGVSGSGAPPGGQKQVLYAMLCDQMARHPGAKRAGTAGDKDGACGVERVRRSQHLIWAHRHEPRDQALPVPQGNLPLPAVERSEQRLPRGLAAVSVNKE